MKAFRVNFRQESPVVLILKCILSNSKLKLNCDNLCVNEKLNLSKKSWDCMCNSKNKGLKKVTGLQPAVSADFLPLTVGKLKQNLSS